MKKNDSWALNAARLYIDLLQNQELPIGVFLRASGQDVNIKDKFGGTALDEAIRMKHNKVAAILTKAKDDLKALQAELHKELQPDIEENEVSRTQNDHQVQEVSRSDVKEEHKGNYLTDSEEILHEAVVHLGEDNNSS